MALHLNSDVGWTAEMLASVIDAAPDALLVVDGHGKIVLASGEVDALFGHARGDLLGEPVEMLLPPSVRAAHESHRDDYFADPSTRPMGSGLALHGQHADGSVFPAEVSLSPLHADGACYVIAAVRDISDRERAERAAHESELRGLILEDRERMASELHDTVIQRLFGAGMRIESVLAIVDDRARERLRAVADDLDATIRELRSAIFGLQAHRDWGAGIRGLILQLARDHAAVLGFEPEVRFEGGVDQLPDHVLDQLLPTLREALSNVARHAGATKATVEVAVDPGQVVAKVSDNGRGATPEVSAGPGLGNLRRRAAALAGELVIQSEPGAGTTLVWRATVLPAAPVTGPAPAS